MAREVRECLPQEGDNAWSLTPFPPDLRISERDKASFGGAPDGGYSPSPSSRGQPRVDEDWWLADKALESSFSYAGYDHLFVRAGGGHSVKHGVATLPDIIALSWR
jgi:hypothetical protein